MLFDEKVSVLFRPTSTLVFCNLPIGRPSGGDVLVEAVEAFCFNTSMVLPVVGLPSVRMLESRLLFK